LRYLSEHIRESNPVACPTVGTLLAQVVDRYGNPVSNVEVNFSATKAESKNPEVPLPVGYRGVEFYREKDCANPFPLYGECASEPAAALQTAHYGAPVEAILGDTVNTRYTVQAGAPAYPGLDPLNFVLNTTGYRAKGDYLAPGLYIRYLDIVTDGGEPANAAAAGDTLPAPLTAELFLLYDDYEMVESVCAPQYDGGPIGCWAIQSTGIVKARPIADGTTTFTPVSGEGAVVKVANLDNGKYQATYKTGNVPAVNTIEAFGEATVTVPQAAYDSNSNKALTRGYPSATLQERIVTLKTGQEALFDPSTGEPVVAANWQKASYTVYGVGVELTVEPTIVVLSADGYASESTRLKYTVSPPEYAAAKAEVDLYRKDPASGTLSLVGHLFGDAAKGSGEAVLGAWNRLDPNREYLAQPVLSRGTAVEVKGEKVPIRTLLCDLDIDSDNNAGFAADGSPLGPSGDRWEDQVEDVEGRPGKVIRPNLADSDGDTIPDFAETDPGAAFYPAVLHLGGSLFDPNTATVTFSYPGSDPANITQSTDTAGKTTYTPAPGSLRLWKKDGRMQRETSDYITPGKAYSLGQLNLTPEDQSWRLYVEGITASNGTGDQRIAIRIDPDGDGPLPPIEGDAVRVTAPFVGLVPDYNHNRQIDEEDRQRAARGDTFYFWINDDDDEGETEGNDIPQEKGLLIVKRDCDNDIVDGMRDLADFFPVSLDLKLILDIFPPDTYHYRFRAEEENVNIIFTSLTPDKAGNYLTDVPTAREIAEAHNYRILKNGFAPYSQAPKKLNEFLQRMREDGTAGVVLLEGSAPGNKPLELSVWNAAGTEVFAARLNLSLAGVEQMFRHKNMIVPLRDVYKNTYQREGLPDHDLVPDMGMSDRFEVDGNFHGFKYPAHFSGFDAESDNNNFVHVHGYNVNDQAARGEQAEAFKRLYWSGSKAKFWGVTWYGWESQWPIVARSPNYHVNVRHAFNTGRLLKDFVNEQVAENVTVFAHSLGNIVVSNAIREGMHISRYLMVNPAIAEEAFTPEAAYVDSPAWTNATKESMYHPAWRYPDGSDVTLDQGYQPFLWASEWYKQFAPGDERTTLTWRDIFSAVRERETYVYYTPTDEAFRPFNYTIEMVADGAAYQPNISDWPGWEDVAQNWSPTNRSKLGTYAWAIQELFKGRFLALGDKDSDAGGWGFNLDPRDGYYICDEQSSLELPPNCILISPLVANAPKGSALKSRPFFSKNSDHDGLYSDQPVPVPAALQEEFLANELPALTFSAGHRGVKKILTEHENRDIDIRQKFAVGEPWPRDRPRHEWRHSDVYGVAYPYLSRLYDEWVKTIQGAVP
jgi:hypothetical protein